VQLAIARIEAAGIMGHVRRGLVVAVRGLARWCQWTSAYLFASPGGWASDTEARSAEVSMEKKKAQTRAGEGVASALPAAAHAKLAAQWGLLEDAAESMAAPVGC
jgi:hypothetical protein